MELQDFKKKYNYDHCTPMMKQYLDIKFSYINYLVFFRMGDFYEMFFDDAIKASKILNIVLTHKGKINNNTVHMCGIPHHSLENYLKKLIDDGCQVAICEQLESPEEAKKYRGYKAVVKRDVVRVITPGTIIEESMLLSNQTNYLVSLVIEKFFSSICFLDITNCNISLIDIKNNVLLDKICWLQPKEILLNENLIGSSISDQLYKLGYKISYQVNSFFAFNKCQNALLEYYNIISTNSLGLVSEQQVKVVGSVISYLSFVYKNNIPKLPLPKIIYDSEFLHIDFTTRKHLEITENISGKAYGSLFNTIDYTMSKLGSRLLYNFISAPLTVINKINTRLNITEIFFNNIELTRSIRKVLAKVHDLNRIITRVNVKKNTPTDLLSIKDVISIALLLKKNFDDYFNGDIPELLNDIYHNLYGYDKLYDLINDSIHENPPNSLREGGVIKLSYNNQIQELNNIIDYENKYLEKLKNIYQVETNIDSLRILHNNILGFFIEVPKRKANKLCSSKFLYKQSTLHVTRYTTSELQNLEQKLLLAKSNLIDIEYEIYSYVCTNIINQLDILSQLSNSLGLLDVYCNFAYIAHEFNFCKPQLTEDLSFYIKNGSHIAIEDNFNKISKTFVKNDCSFTNKDRIYLITGPNMSGKSTFLRQNAIIAILAQSGSFVPATIAKIGIIDKILSRIGSSDDLLKGYSTFMVEMIETSAILAQATENSLIILDEVGRGTSTYDGVAIAWSIIEYIHDILKCRCFFTTHYHELIEMSKSLTGLKNYTICIKEHDNEIVFLYNIIEGYTNKSYGIHVAKLSGLPSSVINRSYMILKNLENKSNIIECSKNINSVVNNDSVNTGDILIKYLNKVNLDDLSPKEALLKLYYLKSLV